MWGPDTHASACAFQSASVWTNAFKIQWIKVYFFQTTSVRMYFF